MRKFILIGTVLILTGAGCSSTGTPVSKNGGNKNAVQPSASQNATVAPSQASQPATVPANQTQTQTQTKTQTQTQTNNTATAAKTFTLAEVVVYNSPAKCWTVVNDKVYDVTAYAPKHPGGSAEVYAMCGKDGSSLFNNKHGGEPKPEAQLQKLLVGTLK